MKKLFRRLTALLCALTLCLSFASALSVEDAIALLKANYIDELPAAAYEAATLDELFEILGDPYTYYMPAEGYQSFRDEVESEVSVTGIGVTIDYDASGILITSTLPGGGAQEVGLTAGDRIIAIDGVSCVPAAAAHRELIVGEEGTFVTLTVIRTDGTTQDLRIERRHIEIHNTNVSYENGVCTIDCDSFGSLTKDYFFGGVTGHPDTKLWVIDLRGNTGGLTSPAVYALGIFTGVGYKLFFRDGSGLINFSSYVASRLSDKPVIVLVDGFTASSSEILSGGIRAEGAGLVIGSRTYGKGTAQVVLDEEMFPELFHGDALKITMSRYYNADGCTTDKLGVLPTLLVDDAYTDEVLSLLSVDKPTSTTCLKLTFHDIPFYVDVDAARTEGHGAALSKLLSALPPDARVTLLSASGEELITSSQALARYGNAADSRCFTDVVNSPYAMQINTLATYDLLSGVGNGRFAPTAALTRAELAAMLAKLLKLSDAPSGLFTDVPEGSWYAGKVGAVAKLGLMNGTGDGRFDPDAALSQEQFIAIMGRLARFLNFKVDAFAANTPAEELDADTLSALAPWARLNALTLTECDEHDNMLYTDLSRIDPHARVTREQAAATLCNILKELRILSY